MAENIVGSLFGLTPQMYGEQQRLGALNEGIAMAKLTPGQAGAAMTYAGSKGLGNAIGGAMGVQDPQLQMISARNAIAQQLDMTNPESIIKGAQMLAQIGDRQGAFALADYARKAQSEIAQAQQRLSAANRERQQAVPTDIQVANEIATLEDTLSQLENVEASPERTRAKNLLNTRLAELRRITTKGEKAVAANIKEIGVAEGTREPVYLDVNNDLQFVYKKGADGKQVRVPFTGGVDRTTAKTSLSVDTKGKAAFVEKLNELDAKRVSAAMDARDNAEGMQASLNALSNLNESQLISGSFATGRVGAANLLSSLGLVNDADKNTLANSESYQKISGDAVLRMLGGKLGSGFSNDDRKFIVGLVPQLENSALARKKLIDFMTGKNKKIIEDATDLENYARTNDGLKGYKTKTIFSTPSSSIRPYSGLSDAELNARIRAAQGQQPQ